MKKIAVLTLFTLGICSLSACGQNKYPSMITILVVDDLGVPVSQGEVKLSTFSHWVPGEGFGRDEDDNYSAPLDDKGRASFKVQNIRGSVAYGIYPDGRYYSVTMRPYQFRQVENGRWEPWNPEVTVVVPRILNPIPLYARRVGYGPNLEMPNLGPVGFDLVVCDWVAPYGVGKRPDFLFERKIIVPVGDPTKAFESIFTLTFANAGDGIQASLASPQQRLLKLSREAPETGYEPVLVKRVARAAEGAVLENGTREDQNYYFRIRTEIDSNGKIISALYGKIYGDMHFFAITSPRGMVKFIYYLNPVSLDRNLEFDPKRNLFPRRVPETSIDEP